jgi:hypothetical protein
MIGTITKTGSQVFATANDPIDVEYSEFICSSQDWLSVWLYVCESCEDILTEDLFINEVAAIKMARRLQESIDNGAFEIWKQKWNNVSRENHLNEEIMHRFTNFCGFSGGFQV